MRASVYVCEGCGGLAHPSSPRKPPTGWLRISVDQVGGGVDRYVVCSSECRKTLTARLFG